jgi:hypothetical protein
MPARPGPPRLTLGRNDAIQWNAIVVIVSTVKIVAFAEVVPDDGWN